MQNEYVIFKLHTSMLPRHAERTLQAFTKNFKVVLLCGARQTGKTTLLKKLFPTHTFITFDQNQDLYNARLDPDLFLKNFPAPLILDEIQFAPELLPALKRHIDMSEATGQYILTGSQNLMMMKHVTESLAGRVGILELFPFTYFELYEQNSWLSAYLESDMDHIRGSVQTKSVAELIWRGGLPGLYQKDNEIVTDYHLSYVRTYIERDVRLSENIHNLAEFNRFVRLTAVLTAQEVNDVQLGRDIGMSHTTAHRWRDVLKQNYQWQEILPYFGNTIKRLSKKPKGYCMDSGLACSLIGIGSPQALMAHPNLGALFETYCVNMILSWLRVHARAAQAYHWRTSNQTEVDLVIDLNGLLYPIEIKCKTNVTPRDTSGLKAFLENYKTRVANGIILYAGDQVLKIGDAIWAVPFTSISQ